MWDYFAKRSQDQINYFHDAGHIYWATTKDLLKYKNTTNKALGYYKDHMSVQDINNKSDWKLAALKFKLIKSNRSWHF